MRREIKCPARNRPAAGKRRGQIRLVGPTAIAFTKTTSLTTGPRRSGASGRFWQLMPDARLFEHVHQFPSKIITLT